MGIAYQPGVQFPCPELKCGRVRPFSSPGGLAERSNAADLKSVSPQGLGGSNPSPSARPSMDGWTAPMMLRLLFGLALVADARAIAAMFPNTWCKTFSKDRAVVEW